MRFNLLKKSSLRKLLDRYGIKSAKDLKKFKDDKTDIELIFKFVSEMNNETLGNLLKRLDKAKASGNNLFVLENQLLKFMRFSIELNTALLAVQRTDTVASNIILKKHVELYAPPEDAFD